MNPAELARVFVSKGLRNEAEMDSDPLNFTIDPYHKLNEYAQGLHFVEKKFIVQSGVSLALAEHEEPTDHTNLIFEGEFVAYNNVIPPRYLGGKAIKGFCLSFENITVLPFYEMLQGVRLHVPLEDVQAIDSFY